MSVRTERVGRLIQREVAGLLGTEFSEPLQAFVTVTGVRMTKDLSIAYVDVSIMGDSEAQRQITFRQLQELTPQIRTTLAQQIRHQVRRIPELRFFLDETFQEAKKMEDILNSIREERDRRS